MSPDRTAERRLVALQGGNVVNPLTLAWLGPLVATCRIYAPDTIGQPGKTRGPRVSANDSSLGDWVVDVLDALELPSAAFVAASYGAGVFLRLATVAPTRIDRAVLVVPAAMTSVPVRSMLSLAAGYWRIASCGGPASRPPRSDSWPVRNPTC